MIDHERTIAGVGPLGPRPDHGLDLHDGPGRLGPAGGARLTSAGRHGA